MFTVFIFITLDGQVRDPVIQRHGMTFTVADGTLYFCGAFWSVEEAETARSVADHVIKTVTRNRALSGLADQTYMHHVISVKGANDLKPTLRVFTREMRCQRGQELSIEASYTNALEAQERTTQVARTQLPRYRRDQFGEN